MNTRWQFTELSLKQLTIVTLFGWGLCGPVHAQSPQLSPPTLPSLPPVPGVTAPAVTPAAPSKFPLPTPAPVAANTKTPSPIVGGVATNSPAAPLPPQPPVPTASPTAEAVPGIAAGGPVQGTVPATLPPPPAPEASEKATAAPPLALPTPVGAPALPLPGVGTLPLPTTAASGLPSPTQEDTLSTLLGNATALPDIKVEAAKPKIPTWETKLAPSITPPKTRFDYRRSLLPDTIYRTGYSSDNRHLPRRITTEDYAELLFKSVARNDVDGTRALLNAGTSPGILNEYGETPLMLAQRVGATEVAALLTTRGAR